MKIIVTLNCTGDNNKVKKKKKKTLHVPMEAVSSMIGIFCMFGI